MHLDTGIDIIEIDRIKKTMEEKGQRFLKRIFAPEEIEYISKKKANNIKSIAVRFCAKEACAKALGTGIGDISWREILVCVNERGKPYIKLKGKAKDILGDRKISLSLSHSAEWAVAMVVIYE